MKSGILLGSNFLSIAREFPRWTYQKILDNGFFVVYSINILFL